MAALVEDKVYQKALASVDFIYQLIPGNLQSPTTGIICGSGLNGLADSVHSDSRFEIPYGEIPNFPQSTGNNSPGIVLCL